MAEPTSQLEALITQAAFAPVHNVGWIRVTGEDRVRWLNGMVTNSITALKPGEGCYNFFLNAQGRIQGDCTAWLQPDYLRLETAADQVPKLIAYLERFIIMDDVELITGPPPLDPPSSGLLIAGPAAPAMLRAIGVVVPDEEMRMTVHEEMWVDIHKAHSPVVPRFEFWPGDSTVSRLLSRMSIPEATPADLEHLRLLEATPLYGTDIRDKELPQETNQTRALHFSKGCYLGQEIVERIRSRGQVNRLFQPLLLTGTVPEPGTILTANDKPAGELTSVADVPGHGILALGYVRREALESKAILTYPGGTATTRS